MNRAKWTAFFTLCGLVAVGVTTGITTPSQLQAKMSLRAAETTSDQLFHSVKLGSDGLSCNSCHVDGGRFSHRLGARRIPSLVWAKDAFPAVRPGGQVVTLEEQIDDCIVHAMKGKPLPMNSQKLALLDVYIRRLSRFHER